MFYFFFLFNTDLVLAVSNGIRRIKDDDIDPWDFHYQVAEMYSWVNVAERTEKVRFQDVSCF